MLSQIQTHLESIYRIEAPQVSEFMIDASQVLEVLGEDARIADEWVLVREVEGGLDLAVFIAEEHLDRLADSESLAHAAETAFPSFCVATEGVSHFLMLVERSRRTEPVSMLELEVQAEVDKFVCATLHHPRRSQEWWQRLFREASLSEGLGSEEVERYLQNFVQERPGVAGSQLREQEFLRILAAHDSKCRFLRTARVSPDEWVCNALRGLSHHFTKRTLKNGECLWFPWSGEGAAQRG